MAETGLGLQDLAAFDKERRDVVTESMKTRTLYAATVRESSEAVPECSGRDSPSMVGIGTEQPDTELLVGCVAPLALKAVPQRRSGRTDCQCSIAPGLGRADCVGRRWTADVQDPATTSVSKMGWLTGCGHPIDGQSFVKRLFTCGNTWRVRRDSNPQPSDP